MVEKTGICKISNFSISKRMVDVTTSVDEQNVLIAMGGSVFWMAPEVVNTGKRDYNSKVDIWSVGCVVLEMWSGERPWRKVEAVAVAVKVRDDFIVNLSTQMIRLVSYIPLTKLLPSLPA